MSCSGTTTRSLASNTCSSAADWRQPCGSTQVGFWPRFPYIETLTPASIEDFYRARLREVVRETVRKDRAVLLRFTRWASRGFALR